tara:strand:- start:609 stop:1097 length:489 start_codon:yes stop_codon:yes gene_type:complete
MIEFLNSMQEYNSVVFSYSDYAYIAIGLGMVISLFLTETIGVMAGGIIVPGYFALYLQNPIQTITTFFIGCLTYFIISLLSKFMLIYGRRRLILCLLLGFLLGYCFRLVVVSNNLELNYIGFIIPGLIASWMDRQGVFRTVSVIMIVASIVHLFLILIVRLS